MNLQYKIISQKLNILVNNRFLAILSVLSVLIYCALFQSACKKLVEIKGPVTSINGANVYSNDATAISVLNGIYAKMSFSNRSFTGNASISLFAGLSADELTLFNGVTSENYIAYYKNSLASNLTQNFGTEHWSGIYNLIFACNAAIEGITISSTLTSTVKQHLLGEAKFARAFFYFYLINLYGDVPLVTSVDYSLNTSLSRSQKSLVYQQIISDLKDAQTTLSDNYLDVTLVKTTSERVRPTKWAASALLSRVYLFTGDYLNAETEASGLISNSSLFNLSSLNDAFLKASLNNNEAIWQIQPVRTGWNTEDARTFIIPTNGPSEPNGSDGNPVYLSSGLLNDFELGDQRRVKWVDSIIVLGKTYYYPFKYKINKLNSPVSEYLMVLRLAEQYLIRAEARLQLNNLIGAQSDLNVIRTRAGLQNTTANDKQSLLIAIMHERRIELFTEWGHRWFDLKRANNIDAVMAMITPLKGGGTWQSYQQLYPLLYSDIQTNPNLVQNSGY